MSTSPHYSLSSDMPLPSFSRGTYPPLPDFFEGSAATSATSSQGDHSMSFNGAYYAYSASTLASSLDIVNHSGSFVPSPADVLNSNSAFTVPIIRLEPGASQLEPPSPQHFQMQGSNFLAVPTNVAHPRQTSTPLTPLETTPVMDDLSDMEAESPESLSFLIPPTRTPYICPICSGVFPKRSRLETHLLSHTGERPHGCTFRNCSSRFATKSNLNRHMSNRHGLTLERRGSRAQRARSLSDAARVDPLFLLLAEPSTADLSLIF